MIRAKYREICLEVKEMLSSEGGAFNQSMAPLIGGPRPFWGKLCPVDRLVAVMKKDYDAGGIHGKIEYVYNLQAVLIDENNWIMVYRDYYLGPVETELAFVAWAHHFHEEKQQEL